MGRRNPGFSLRHGSAAMSLREQIEIFRNLLGSPITGFLCQILTVTNSHAFTAARSTYIHLFANTLDMDGLYHYS